MRVLLIEDDIALAKAIELSIAAEGIISDISTLGVDGIEFSKLYQYSLIILDLMLPDINGYEVLRRIRGAQIDVPILILSGLDTPEEKIKGLSCGADDYLSKPFDRGELIARLKAVVRRSQGQYESAIKAHNLIVDTSNHTTKLEGKPLHLTSKEQDILEILITRKGKILTKEYLMHQLYDDSFEPDVKIIDVFVCKLRKKLYDASGGLNYIETIWGRGYSFKEPSEMAANN